MTAPTPAEMAPPAPRRRAAAPLAAAGAARGRGAAAGAGRRRAAAEASLAMKNFLKITSVPSGNTAASALVVCAQLRAKTGSARSLQVAAHGGGLLSRPSATCPSSSRTSSQVSSRASEASARPTRARTSSDFTLGTVVSIASAIWS